MMGPCEAVAANPSAERTRGARVTAVVTPRKEVSGEYKTWTLPSLDPVMIYGMPSQQDEKNEPAVRTNLIDLGMPGHTNHRGR